MKKLKNKLVNLITGTIISNIKLDEAILLCALKAEQEERNNLAAQLKRLNKEV